MDKITVHGLTVRIDGTEVLHSINLGIPERQVTAITGSSGCGKSTLLRTLNRIGELAGEWHADGEVLLDGENILHMADTDSLRRRVGMVFQSPAAFPMSIYGNVAFGLRCQGAGSGERLDAAVERALRDAALWNEVRDRLKKPAGTLSGGQQQRLCIARALAVEPEVLLMDEPTSALDSRSTGLIEELMLRLRERLTVVLVTHSMEQAKRVAGRTVFMSDGRVVQ